MAAKKVTAAAAAEASAEEVVSETVAAEPVVTEPVVTEAVSTAAAEPAAKAAEPAFAAKVKQIETGVKKTMDSTIKTTEEMMAFGQGNVEAFLKSGQIWVAGVQDLSKHIAATAQASIDETVANVKALSSVKSLKEAMDLQATIAKTSVEKFVAESGKITDATVKLAEQTIAPISARVTLATEKFGRVAG